MDTDAFKKDITRRLASAVSDLGGIDRVRFTYEMMPSIIDFLVGWIVRDIDRPVTQEETRRIYDLVRLTVDTKSSTS